MKGKPIGPRTLKTQYLAHVINVNDDIKNAFIADPSRVASVNFTL